MTPVETPDESPEELGSDRVVPVLLTMGAGVGLAWSADDVDGDGEEVDMAPNRGVGGSD